MNNEDLLTFLDVFADSVKNAVAALRGNAGAAAGSPVKDAAATKPAKEKKAKRRTVLQMVVAVLRKSEEPMEKAAILAQIEKTFKRTVSMGTLNTMFNGAIKSHKYIKRTGRGLYTNIRRKGEEPEVLPEAAPAPADVPVEANLPEENPQA